MDVSFVQEKGIPKKVWIVVDGEQKRRVSNAIVRAKDIESICQDEHFFERLRDLEVKGAIRYALFCLSRQALHSKKLEKALQRHCVPPDVAAAVLDHCTKSGLLNDDEWMSYKVKKWQSQGKSAADIRARLRRDGIRKDPVCIDETASLERVMTRKYPQLLEEKTPYKERLRALQALYRRGFSPHAVKEFLLKKRLNGIMEQEYEEV
jgi:SOS response regulatory protein OraA/RecX